VTGADNPEAKTNTPRTPDTTPLLNESLSFPVAFHIAIEESKVSGSKAEDMISLDSEVSIVCNMTYYINIARHIRQEVGMQNSTENIRFLILNTS
jgi:hypothetical protein